MKRMLFLLQQRANCAIILLSMMLLSGCLGQSEWEILKPGMTAAEVVALEGRPNDLWTNSDKTSMEAIWMDGDNLHRKLWVRFIEAYDEIKYPQMTVRHNFRWELSEFLRYSYGGPRHTPHNP